MKVLNIWHILPVLLQFPSNLFPSFLLQHFFKNVKCTAMLLRIIEYSQTQLLFYVGHYNAPSEQKILTYWQVRQPKVELTLGELIVLHEILGDMY